MNRLFAGLFLVVAASSTLVGCGGGEKNPVLAEVGDRIITASHFEDAFVRMDPKNRPPVGTMEEKRSFLQDLINKELMELSAMEKFPELNVRQASRLTRFKESEIRGAVKKRLIGDKVPITEEMKDKLYANHSRERDLLALMVLDEGEADYIHKQLEAGGDFAQLSRDHSTQWVSETQAGDLGWVKPGTFPYEFDLQIWDAEVGTLLKPYKLPLGIVIVKVLGERPAEVNETREEMDGILHDGLLQPLYMNRQKAVLDSLRNAAEPYYSDAGKGLLLIKYYWEPPPEYEGNEMAFLDAPRVIPSFTEEEKAVVVVAFKNQPDWTAAEFARRLEWYPSGLWPRGHSEEQLVDVLNLVIRDHLWLKAAEDFGITEDPVLLQSFSDREVEMRVNFFYYNEIVKRFEPDQAGIDTYFQEHRDHYMASPSYKIGFFIARDRELVETLAKDWKSGTSFGDLRTKYEALDPELTAVGESGWIFEGQDVLQDETLAGLKDGDISKTVTRADVTAVFKLIGRRAARPFAYEEIKETVDEHAKTVLIDQGLSEFLAQQGEKYGVTVFDDALSGVEVDVEVAEPEAE